MKNLVNTLERAIVAVLIAMLLITVAVAVIGLARVIFVHISEGPFMLIDTAGLFDIFGLFVVILIGIELLKLMRMFMSEKRIDPALVVEVAIIAVCNKVITFDLKTAGWEAIGAGALLLIGLAAAYVALRRDPGGPAARPE